MKKWLFQLNLVIIFVLLFALMPEKATASNQVDISGGVKNEYDYEEYVFISGKPVKFTGSGKDIKITTKDSKGKRVTTFTYSLQNEKGDSVKRKFTYEADVQEYVLIGQTVQNGTVTSFSEKIDIDGIQYNLVDYQFYNGNTIDNRPASDYYAGDITATKTYEKVTNRKKERIVVNIVSKNEGYTNFWGSTETQITTQEIHFADGKVGLVENRISSNKSRTLNYQENSASLSSFLGGYVVNSQAQMVSQYKYDFGNSEQIITARADFTPVIERLPVPKFRDTANHYAQEAIEQLYSLGIYDEDMEYFNPSLIMQRYEFTISIGKAINLRVFEEPLKKDTTQLFKDVARTKKDYQYLVSAYNKGVIKGVSSTNFNPEGDLTREQAATILIRALGLEGRVQDSQLLSKYSDSHKVSDFAKAAVIEATRIGLMQGNDKGQFNPQGKLSRAEAALVVARFLDYLNRDLNNNYQNNILFY
jgi:hypothetical protein